MKAGEVLARFGGGRRCPNHPDMYAVRCPMERRHSNGDKHPSALVWLSRSRTRPRWLCRCKTCDTHPRDIWKALGVTQMEQLYDDFTPEPAKPGTPLADFAARKVECYYRYEDEERRPLYRVTRYANPKGFAQDRYMGVDTKTGQEVWMAGVQDCRRVLYRLPDLLACPDKPIIIVEGEKDADALWQLKLPATCNVGGTGMGWRIDYNETLRGRRVVIIPDNDFAGRRHAWGIAGCLEWSGVCESVRIVSVCLDGCDDNQCKDVSDYLAHGGTRASLIALIQAASEWRQVVAGRAA